MENLLSAITLTDVSGISILPVDNTYLSDLSDDTINSPYSFIFQSSSALTWVMNDTPAAEITCLMGHIINNNYGLRFRLKFTASFNNFGGSSTCIVRVVISDGIYPVFVQDFSITGVDTEYTYDFNTGGVSFTDVRFQYIISSGSCISGLSLVSMEGLDVSPFSDYDVGDRILCYWEDDDQHFVIKKEDNPGATITTITSGPNLGVLNISQYTNCHQPPDGPGRVNTSIRYSNYAICYGNDKSDFKSNPNNPGFPYFERQITEDSPYCLINPNPDDPPTIVCDIAFIGIPNIINYPINKDDYTGRFSVHAESSHADISYPIKYTFGNYYPNYNSITNTTGEFIGTINFPIYPGKYDVYAYDRYNCIAVCKVIVSLDPTSFQTLYRQEFKDIQSLVTSRVDINQSQYLGIIHEEISDGGSPIELNKVSGDNNDKFSVLRQVNLIISLISTNNFRFIGLYSQNDRKYMANYYKPIGTELFRGFVIPSIYKEPFISTPYPVSISITDALPTLSDYDFVDNSGNTIIGNLTLIQIIMICLNKLNLGIGVKSSINKYCSGMSTGLNDDPLDQTYLDVSTFYDDDLTPLKCDEVLVAVLKPFGAEIIQANGWWNIVECESKTDTYNFRTFDKDGVKISSGNGSFSPLIEVISPGTQNGISYSDRNQYLEIIPAYGKITILNQLKLKNSLFSRTLDKGWQAILLYITTATVGFYDEISGDGSSTIINGVIADNSKKNKFKGFTVNDIDTSIGQFVLISSDDFVFTTLNDSVRINFDYRHILDQAYDDIDPLDPIVTAKAIDPKWVKLKWTLYLAFGGNVYKYSERIGWNTFNSGFYVRNEILIDKFSTEFSSFSRDIELPSFSEATEVSMRLLFEIDGGYTRDFSSEADLKQIPTGVLPLGTKVKGTVGSELIVYYNLVAGTAATSSPDIIRPNDYSDAPPINQVYWKREESDGLIIPVKRIDLQKVIVTLYPNGKVPLGSETISVVNDPFYKENLNVNLICSDLPTNIIHKEIYNSYFKLVDGTPTRNWSRTGISENTTIQQILMKSLVNQYNKPTWKLSGSFVDPDNVLGLLNSVKISTIPANIELTDPDFDNLPNTWDNYGPTGTEWDTFTAEVDFLLVIENSKYFVPSDNINIPGGTRLSFDLQLIRTLTDSENLRTDNLRIVLLKDGIIVQSVIAVSGMYYDDTFKKTIRFNALVDADNVGFYIENSIGTSGTAHYQMIYFRLKALTVVRYFATNSLTINDRNNDISADLYQLIPALSSTDPDIDDTGGGETDPGDGSGGGSGSFNGAYSTGFSGDFDTVLN